MTQSCRATCEGRGNTVHGLHLSAAGESGKGGKVGRKVGGAGGGEGGVLP